ncbi:polysaccharide pyruvyl transferase family protein [Bacteroides acidifaciens]|uniref:polysaccharide pyruvyl transferase family protein n=1 Tax=Bacteroides acidifaciens TaxID=85831 RepID=UPI000F47BEF1|nr:polysaccharide pyruvyl transferase family protein [Bacteroides acidifaciens]ROT18307.1 polysaccharide pyruvyl transferase family protein [Muribaculaceae bacterium Isolate-110 (HZI)]
MKIAVISLKVNANYGGLLQAWALQQILIRLGHNPTLIDGPSHCDLPLFQKCYIYPIRLFNKIFRHSSKPIRHESMLARDWNHNIQGVQQFIDKLNIRSVKTLSEISEDDYDAIIYGSDQVWRPAYFRPFLGDMRNAFGWFARKWKNIRLYSYAASFGIETLDEYTADELKDISSMLGRFSQISVRENSGINLCHKLGVKATHVLDPTMLLNRTDYLQLIDNATGPVTRNKGLMTYILDPSEQSARAIETLSLKLDKEPFSTIAPAGTPANTVEQWLAGFRDADFIVTDSFHACVFSIIFGKPFIVISNVNRGTARIDSLLEMLGLMHHKISVSDLHAISPADYTFDQRNLNTTIQKLREKSFDILKNIN